MLFRSKSVGNRTAAALVGLCVGHPGLVRFGWEGFEQTVADWFLPDGTTSESPAYATMTLGNIWDLPQALRGYSEPADYRDASGRRRTAVDLYHGTAYGRVWENMFRGLQGDLSYPCYADSYRHSQLGGNFVELMVANYPERPEYLALLRENFGADLARRPRSACVLGYGFNRPDVASRRVPRVQGRNLRLAPDGVTFDVVSPWGTAHVRGKVLGRFNEIGRAHV